MAEYDDETQDTPTPRGWQGGSKDFTVTHEAHSPRIWGQGYGPRDREAFDDPSEDDNL